MKEKLRQFMIGRYGMDELGRFLNGLTIALLILGMFGGELFSILTLAALGCWLFRALSRDRGRRIAENNAYLRLKVRVTQWFGVQKSRFSQRGEYRYFTCPGCRQSLRVPKGKGDVTITCPKCNTRFSKRS